jgi:hypothetical protein
LRQRRRFLGMARFGCGGGGGLLGKLKPAISRKSSVYLKQMP